MESIQRLSRPDQRTLVSTKEFYGLNDLPLPELFRLEVETQSAILRQELLALRSCPSGTHRLDGAHASLALDKGCGSNRQQELRRSRCSHDGRLVSLAAQDNAASLPPGSVDTLLRGVDFLGCICKKSQTTRLPDGKKSTKGEIDAFLASLALKG